MGNATKLLILHLNTFKDSYTRTRFYYISYFNSFANTCVHLLKYLHKCPLQIFGVPQIPQTVVILLTLCIISLRQ